MAIRILEHLARTNAQGAQTSPIAGTIQVTGVYPVRQNAKGTSVFTVGAVSDGVRFGLTIYDAGRGGRFVELHKELTEALKASGGKPVMASFPTSRNELTNQIQYAGSMLDVESRDVAGERVKIFSTNDLVLEQSN